MEMAYDMRLRINIVDMSEPWHPGVGGYVIYGSRNVRRALGYIRRNGWRFISDAHVYDAWDQAFEVGVMTPDGMSPSDAREALRQFAD